MLCVLMLRGPQTVGELRGRTERLYTFDDLESVENTLHRLAEIGFVKKLPRQTGYKEQRWAQLLAGDVEVAEEAPKLFPASGPRPFRSRADRHPRAGGRRTQARLRRLPAQLRIGSRKNHGSVSFTSFNLKISFRC